MTLTKSTLALSDKRNRAVSRLILALLVLRTTAPSTLWASGAPLFKVQEVWQIAIAPGDGLWLLSMNRTIKRDH